MKTALFSQPESGKSGLKLTLDSETLNHCSRTLESLLRPGVSCFAESDKAAQFECRVETSTNYEDSDYGVVSAGWYIVPETMWRWKEQSTTRVGINRTETFEWETAAKLMIISCRKRNILAFELILYEKNLCQIGLMQI